MNFKGLLKVNGKYIVDENNNNYILRGLGIGGWLVKEGYMLKTKAPSPSTIDEAIIDLLGRKNGEIFLNKYIDNWFNELDIKAIKEFGFNSIRIPFHYKNISRKYKQLNDDAFILLDKTIALCKKYDLYVILDMHCAPGSQNGQNISDDLTNDAKLYSQNKKYQPGLNFIWKEIAKHYVNEDYIAGYDVINEPVLNKENTMDELKKSYISLTKAIREVDNRHIIFIEGNKYATQFEGLEPPFDDNMVYSFHKYWNECSKDAIRKYLDLRDKYNVPLWMSEIGENSNEWYYQNIKMYEEENIGWNWWTVKKLNNNNSIYSIKLPKNYDKLQNYWFNKGPKPTKKEAKIILDELLENMKFENLIFQKGVLYSIIDHKKYKDKKAYKDFIIPTTINASHYDYGGPNTSYYKSNYMRDEFHKYGYNSQNIFRNDGVDILTINNEYEVLLSEINQYIDYTFININENTYSIYLETNGRGNLSFYLNEELIISKSFNSNQYINTKLFEINLKEKNYTLRIKVNKPCLTIKNITIKKVI